MLFLSLSLCMGCANPFVKEAEKILIEDIVEIEKDLMA